VAGAVDEARYLFVRGDICTPGLVAELVEAHAIDTIVHFAARRTWTGVIISGRRRSADQRGR
jgi:dTDP-D-glucose 4,6-dehydratase